MAIFRNLLSVLILILSGSAQLHAHANQDCNDHSLTKIFQSSNQNILGYQKNTWSFHVKAIPALHERAIEKSNMLNKEESDEDENISVKKIAIADSKYFISSFYPKTKDTYRLPTKSLSPDEHFHYSQSGRDRGLVFCVLRI